MSSKYIPLGDLVDIKGGGTPSRAVHSYWNGSIPWASVKDLKGFQLSITSEHISPEGLNDSASNLIPAGNVIIATRMGLGKVAINTVDMAINQDLKALICKPNLDSRYLLHFLHSKASFLEAQGKGATVKGITLDTVKDLQVPCLSLPDQKRIAAILDKADAIRRKREKAIELIDSFLRSVFLQMFGDPNVNQKGWEVKTVGEVCACIVPGRDKPRSFSGGTPWILSDDLVHGGYTFDSKSEIGLAETEIAEVRARKIPEGSVLMTCVGRLGIVSIAGCDMVINQQLHSFQCSPAINNIFLLALLPWKKRYMEQHASATTVPYMNKTVCNSIPVIVPPVSLQNRFAEIASKQLLLRSKLTNQLAQVNTLGLSLSQSLFEESPSSRHGNHSSQALEVAHAL
jgi:type I restriction enzyme S subunit